MTKRILLFPLICVAYLAIGACESVRFHPRGRLPYTPKAPEWLMGMQAWPLSIGLGGNNARDKTSAI